MANEDSGCASKLVRNIISRVKGKCASQVEAEQGSRSWVTSISYPQSATRQLAFRSPDERNSVPNVKKPLNDFYNNATLSLIAKIFSLAIIVAALVMVLKLLEKNLMGSGMEMRSNISML